MAIRDIEKSASRGSLSGSGGEVRPEAPLPSRSASRMRSKLSHTTSMSRSPSNAIPIGSNGGGEADGLGTMSYLGSSVHPDEVEPTKLSPPSSADQEGGDGPQGPPIQTQRFSSMAQRQPRNAAGIMAVPSESSLSGAPRDLRELAAYLRMKRLNAEAAGEETSPIERRGSLRASEIGIGRTSSRDRMAAHVPSRSSGSGARISESTRPIPSRPPRDSAEFGRRSDMNHVATSSAASSSVTRDFLGLPPLPAAQASQAAIIADRKARADRGFSSQVWHWCFTALLRY